MRSRRRQNASLIVVAVLVSSGCGTMLNGPRQSVLITSEPAGANVFIDARVLGVTPVTVELPRRREHQVVYFEKEGFASQELALTRRTSAYLWADFALGAGPRLDSPPGQWLAGSAINLAWMFGLDIVTGGAFTLPSHLHATLTPMP